ncbi:MAG: zinc ribbon domain-containing protein [bacterium]
MPIHRYQCRKCGKHFEMFQRITDEPVKKCSFCGGKATKVESESSISPSPASATILRPTYERVAEKKVVRKLEKRPVKVGRKA